MKKILLSVLTLFMASAFLYGQQEVTKFLGIPVDGFKHEMIQKLKEKGFVSTAIDKDVLEGEFNGRQVHVRVVTNNNKVYRIHLADVHNLGETDLKIRFNNLCRQFENNANYIGLSDQTIADDEDISYEITVNDKRYEAVFYQKPADSTAILEEIDSDLLNDSIMKEILDRNESAHELVRHYAFMLRCSTRPVWFRINKILGKYYFSMYYDNELNKARGEDL